MRIWLNYTGWIEKGRAEDRSEDRGCVVELGMELNWTRRLVKVNMWCHVRGVGLVGKGN